MSEIGITIKERKTPKGELKELLNRHIDRIPNEIIRSSSPVNNYKVRKGWFTAVICNLESCLAEEEIADPKTKQEAEEFVHKYTSPEYQKRKTTEEDIKKANEIITSIISK